MIVQYLSLLEEIQEDAVQIEYSNLLYEIGFKCKLQSPDYVCISETK